MFNSKIYLKITKYLNNLRWTILLSYKNLKLTILIGFYNLKWTILNKFNNWNLFLKKRFKFLKKTIKKRFKTLRWNIKIIFRTLKGNIKTIFKFLYYKAHLLYNKLNIILYNIRLSLLIEVQLNTRWWVKIIHIDIFLITTVIIYFIFVIALPMWKATVHLPVIHLDDPGKALKVEYIVTPNFITDFNLNHSKEAINIRCEEVLAYTTDPRRRDDTLLRKMGAHFTNYFRYRQQLENISIYHPYWNRTGPITDPQTIVLTDSESNELAYRVERSPHAHRYLFIRDERGIVRIHPIETPTKQAKMDSYLLDAVVRSQPPRRS